MDKFVGPATLVYLISISVAGVWWASDISSRMSAAENQIKSNVVLADKITQTGEKIIRLETILTSVDKQLDNIDAKLDKSR